MPARRRLTNDKPRHADVDMMIISLLIIRPRLVPETLPLIPIQRPEMLR